MKKLLLILLVCIVATSTRAQNGPVSTGGNAVGTGGSASYSIGQVVYTTNTGTNGSVAQGVQQPYEISVITEVEQAKNINLVCSAYPNPTVDLLTLKVDNFKLSSLSYRLYDLQGKLLQSEKITDSQTSIVMSNLVPATYFVKVILKNKELKTFKIIKNH